MRNEVNSFGLPMWGIHILPYAWRNDGDVDKIQAAENEKDAQKEASVLDHVIQEDKEKTQLPFFLTALLPTLWVS